jgi:hypothetical protein
MAGGAGSPVVLSQHWDDFPGTSWQFDPYFYVGMPDTVTFTMKFADGADAVPITGHTIDMVVQKVDVSAWDDATQNYDYMSYTSIASNAAPNASPPIIYQADLSQYASFAPPASADSGNGTYVSDLTVQDDDVDTAYFDASDEGAYLD